MLALGVVVAALLLVWSSLLYIPLRWRPVGGIFLFPKLAAGALAPFIAVSGLLVALLGAAAGSALIAVLAGTAALAAAVAVVRIALPQTGLVRAFGSNWPQQIPEQNQAAMLRRRWRWRLPPPASARCEHDLPFAVVPGSAQVLRCDLWQPPAGVPASGLGLVYLHGSAWTVLDKDSGTAALFGRLAAQGHVIMDVAYRLFPDTDLPGMVADAKRAVAWLKTHAGTYGIRPDRVVLAGASAGGHLTLLGGFAPHQPSLTPGELAAADVTVCGVVSLYGPADLAAMYHHVGQAAAIAENPDPSWAASPPPWVRRLFDRSAERLGFEKFAVAGRFDLLLGGTPEQVPHRYAWQSPINHVYPGCPPTLLLHGVHDMMAPVSATRTLARKLDQAGVPVVCVITPHADHGFDLMLPTWSPPAQAALYELERFLAILAAVQRPHHFSDQRAG
jgi:acetyl esterase/lipase